MQTDHLRLDRVRRLRREMTEPERRLWEVLRDRKLADTKFVRQTVVGGRVPDFVARSAGLVVEVDGDTHTDQMRDDRRSAELRQKGYRVIPFSNADVVGKLAGVCVAIIAALGAASHPILSPTGRGLDA